MRYLIFISIFLVGFLFEQKAFSFSHCYDQIRIYYNSGKSAMNPSVWQGDLSPAVYGSPYPSSHNIPPMCRAADALYHGKGADWFIPFLDKQLYSVGICASEFMSRVYCGAQAAAVLVAYNIAHKKGQGHITSRAAKWLKYYLGLSALAHTARRIGSGPSSGTVVFAGQRTKSHYIREPSIVDGVYAYVLGGYASPFGYKFESLYLLHGIGSFRNTIKSRNWNAIMSAISGLKLGGEMTFIRGGSDVATFVHKTKNTQKCPLFAMGYVGGRFQGLHSPVEGGGGCQTGGLAWISGNQICAKYHSGSSTECMPKPSGAEYTVTFGPYGRQGGPPTDSDDNGDTDTGIQQPRLLESPDIRLAIIRDHKNEEFTEKNYRKRVKYKKPNKVRLVWEVETNWSPRQENVDAICEKSVDAGRSKGWRGKTTLNQDLENSKLYVEDQLLKGKIKKDKSFTLTCRCSDNRCLPVSETVEVEITGKNKSLSSYFTDDKEFSDFSEGFEDYRWLFGDIDTATIGEALLEALDLFFLGE